MIRTHIRNLILNVYSVSKNESNVREYLNIFGNDVLEIFPLIRYFNAINPAYFASLFHRNSVNIII